MRASHTLPRCGTDYASRVAVLPARLQQHKTNIVLP